MLLAGNCLAWAADSEAVNKLIAALGGKDEKARIAAIDSLAHLGPAAKGAVGALVGQLSDKSAAVRAHAAHALQLIGPGEPAAVEALIKATTDSDANVRRMAVRALHQIHPAPQNVVDALAKELSDADPAVQIESLNALTDLGEAAVPVLVAALGNEQTRYWAILALGELGEKGKGAVEALVAALKDPRPEVRREVLVTFARMGAPAAPAVSAISAQMNDKDDSVRHAAVFALGRIGPEAASAADALRKARESKDQLMQTVAAWALAHIEPNNEELRQEAVKLLTAVIRDHKSKAQGAALRGLLELEPDPAKVVPVLSSLMADGTPEAVQEAVSAAATLGDQGLPALIEALKRPEVRGRAALLIGRLGPKAGKTAAAALTHALADQDAEVRREVLFALAELGPEAAGAKAEILKQLGDADPRVAAVAAYALGSLGEAGASAAPQLRKTLEAKDPVLRVASAWALVHVSARPEQVASITTAVLVQGLKQENPAVRRGSAEALGRLGKVARSAAEAALKAAAHDSDETVRHAALKALESMGVVVDSPVKSSAPANKR